MNIVIYYLSKKIILQVKNQTSDNQYFTHLDVLKKNQILEVFESFIECESNLLTFETESIEIGLDKLYKTFRLIYAAGGLIEKDSKYLFIYRLKKWDLPKGKLDRGETPEAAAIRECEEECGITKLKITEELPSTYHIYKYKGSYAIKKIFWYSMITEHNGVLVPQIEEKIERVEWFDPYQINEIVPHNSYPAILDVLKNLKLIEN